MSHIVNPPQHTHRTRRNHQGQEVCLECHLILSNPILESDDERLVDAGFMRSEHHIADNQPYGEYPPLPEVLIALYYNGPALGLPSAPVAQYVEQTAIIETRKQNSMAYSDDIWQNLYEGWQRNAPS